MKWIKFWDMHSGGGTKEAPYDKIYIQAENEDIAKVIFQNRFGHNPERVTCTCCGEDYSISEYDSLEAATKYHRTKYDYDFKQHKRTKESVRSLADYLSQPHVLVIREEDIKPEERVGTLRRSGYVWMED